MRRQPESASGYGETDTLPIHPAVQQHIGYVRALRKDALRVGVYEQSLGRCIDLALFERDASAMGMLLRIEAKFAALPDALAGDREAQDIVAHAFMRICCFSEASAFSILAGKGPWQWHRANCHKVDHTRRMSIVEALPGYFSVIA